MALTKYLHLVHNSPRAHSFSSVATLPELTNGLLLFALKALLELPRVGHLKVVSTLNLEDSYLRGSGVYYGS